MNDDGGSVFARVPPGQVFDFHLEERQPVQAQNIGNTSGSIHGSHSARVRSPLSPNLQSQILDLFSVSPLPPPLQLVVIPEPASALLGNIPFSLGLRSLTEGLIQLSEGLTQLPQSLTQLPQSLTQLPQGLTQLPKTMRQLKNPEFRSVAGTGEVVAPLKISNVRHPTTPSPP